MPDFTFFMHDDAAPGGNGVRGLHKFARASAAAVALFVAAATHAQPAPAATSAVEAPVIRPSKPAPVWSQMPTSADLSRLYPSEALRNELQAHVVATCRIAEDLSLACMSFEINPPEHTMFEAAARRILALYRAAPQLKDGKDAVGALVRVPIRFQLEDDPPP